MHDSSKLRGLVVTGLALLLVACSPAGTKGTMPPAGPNGDVDPSAAPDFIAVAGVDRDIVGYVPKRFLFPQPTTSAELPHEEPWPVYAEDLRTLIGHMVQGKGFVPLGVDPATVPDRPVEQGPSFPLPSGASRGLTVYVRNAIAKQTWIGVMIGGVPGGPFYAFGSGVGVGCLSLVEGGRAVVLDRPPQDAGAGTGREIHVGGDQGAGAAVWVDVNGQGLVIDGQGVPPWWTDAAQSC